MAKILIAPLGAGAPDPNQQSKYPTRKYRETLYKIEDEDKEYRESFVTAALYDYLNLDGVIFVGTVKSIWEEVYWQFCQKKGVSVDENYWQILSNKISSGETDYKTPFDELDLTPIEKMMGERSKCILVKYGINSAELDENLKIIMGIFDLLQEGDEVYIDITHAFRWMTMFESLLVTYLNNILPARGIKVGGIYYGMLEAFRELKYAPIIRLDFLFSKISEELQQKYAELQTNIFQAMSHTLANMLAAHKNMIANIKKGYDVAEVRRLGTSHDIMVSLVDSIKISFSDISRLRNKIEIFNQNGSDRISLYHLFYFCFNLSLHQLLQGGGKWEGTYLNFFSSNGNIDNELIEKVESIQKNETMLLSNMMSSEINNFIEYFHNDLLKMINQYFEINIDDLKNIFVTRDGYTFSILFTIFLELTTNMLRYGSIRDSQLRKFVVKSVRDRDVTQIKFTNFVSKQITEDKSSTLQGLEMAKFFTNVVGNIDQKPESRERFNDRYDRFTFTINIK